jgi:hypothetical protein
MAPAVEHLPSKHKVLSSNPHPQFFFLVTEFLVCTYNLSPSPDKHPTCSTLVLALLGSKKGMGSRMGGRRAGGAMMASAVELWAQQMKD